MSLSDSRNRRFRKSPSIRRNTVIKNNFISNKTQEYVEYDEYEDGKPIVKEFKKEVRFGDYSPPTNVKKKLLKPKYILKNFDKNILNEIAEECVFETILHKYEAKYQIKINSRYYETPTPNIYVACKKGNCNYFLNIYNLSDGDEMSKEYFNEFSTIAAETSELGLSPKIIEINMCSIKRLTQHQKFHNIGWILSENYLEKSIGSLIPYNQSFIENIFGIIYELGMNNYYVFNIHLNDIGLTKNNFFLITNYMKTNKIYEKEKISDVIYEMLFNLLPTLTFTMSDFEEYYYDDLNENKKTNEIIKVYENFTNLYNIAFQTNINIKLPVIFNKLFSQNYKLMNWAKTYNAKK